MAELRLRLMATCVLAIAGASLTGCSSSPPPDSSQSTATAPAAARPRPAPPATLPPANGRPETIAGRLPHRRSQATGAAPPPPPRPAAEPPPPAPEPVAPTLAGSAEGVTLDAYVARVSATKQLARPGKAGDLDVWIGSPKFLPHAAAETVNSTASLGMTGQTAKITPFAPDFDVVPATTICETLVPSGSEVHFALHPRSSGNFSVGAQVELYASADCSGAPVPKSTNMIDVHVQVCKGCVVQSGLLGMAQAAWAAFLHFWGWLLVGFFGTLAFLILRWRNRKFNMKNDDDPLH